MNASWAQRSKIFILLIFIKSQQCAIYQESTVCYARDAKDRMLNLNPPSRKIIYQDMQEYNICLQITIMQDYNTSVMFQLNMDRSTAKAVSGQKENFKMEERKISYRS